MLIIFVARVVDLWKEDLSRTNKKTAESLADPKQYENLFPGMAESLVAEVYLSATEQNRPARNYPLTPVSWQDSVVCVFALRFQIVCSVTFQCKL